MLRRILSLSISISLVTTAVFLAQTRITYAYIDLGTGSYLLQMLMASVLASLFMLKVFWSRLTRKLSQFFSKTNKKKNEVG